MRNHYHITLGIIALFLSSAAMAQNVGISEDKPGSRLSVKGNLSVGSAYSQSAAPKDGALFQGTIGIGTAIPDESAALDIYSTTKGLLIPRMTTKQRAAMGKVASGMLVFDTDSNNIYIMSRGNWYTFIGTDNNSNYIGISQWPSGNAVAGATGATGATGSAGAAGAKGATGATGLTGAPGATGSVGATGAQGIQGPTGATGTAGAAGSAGATGATGSGYAATSTTSATIATGSKTLTIQAGLAYAVANRVRIANSSTNYMDGVVTSYSGTSLVLTVDRIVGSGTFSSWNIGLAGDVGPAGTAGATGATGAQGPAGAAGSGSVSGLTQGQVLFGSSSGSIAQTYGFYWDNGNGRLGVGTGSPSSTLTVGSGNQFQVDNSGNVSVAAGGSMSVASLQAGQLIFPNSSGRFIQNNSLYWDNGNGRLGVGTNSPANTFAVGSGNQFQIDNAGNVVIASGGSLTVNSLQNGQLIFPNNGKFTQNNSLYWDNGNGRLGVGTNAPANTFAVGSGNQFQIDNAGNVVIASGGSLTVNSLQNGQLIFPNNGKFTQNNSLYWDNGNGRLGVGTNAPANTFTVGSGNQFQIDNSGNVSIASGGSLTVNSLQNNQIIFPVNGRFTQNYNLQWDNSASKLSVSGSFALNGNFSGTGTNSYTSDSILKKNIKPIDNALGVIMQLKPSVYQFRTGEFGSMYLPEGQHYGVIAQQLQRVLPELVTKQTFKDSGKDGKDGKTTNYLAVNYNELIPILIKSVQELQTQNELLKTKVEDLEKKTALITR